MSDELSPAALRALADRLEQEASTAAEERQAAAIQRALDSGQDALADKLVDRMLERMGDRLEAAYDAALPKADPQGGEDGEDDEPVQGGGDEADEKDKTDGHDDILPGRYRARKVFGAKLYSGPAEPETVRFRNEKGQLQSRPGRIPGKPYQTEWEPISDDETGEEEDAA